MAEVLTVDDLEVRFHTDRGTVHAVNGVSFHVGEGETLAIVGESGSGKTVSLLSCLQLIPRPPGEITHGQVIFEGRDLLSVGVEEIRRVRGRKIAMIFQDPMTFLNPVLTVGRQITEALELHLRMSRAAARTRAIELLEMVGIPDPSERVRHYPHQFSGGMRQRCMIAMALSCDPRVLIADEPTTALDVTIQAQILDLVRDLKRDHGMSMIWITHDLGVVAGLADRLAVMYAGRIVEEGPLKSVFANPQHPYTLGLLASIPRSTDHRARRLNSIPGQPPSLLKPPEGCSFYDRCDYRIDKCAIERPPLLTVGEGHRAACWVDPATRTARSVG